MPGVAEHVCAALFRTAEPRCAYSMMPRNGSSWNVWSRWNRSSPGVFRFISPSLPIAGARILGDEVDAAGRGALIGNFAEDADYPNLLLLGEILAVKNRSNECLCQASRNARATSGRQFITQIDSGHLGAERRERANHEVSGFHQDLRDGEHLH